MPILKREQDIWPLNLFESLEENSISSDERWWAMYTLPRFEKKLMRQLLDLEISFYGPMIEKKYRSPQGRMRTAYTALFPNYVFVRGNEMSRYRTITTGSVSQCLEVPDPEAFQRDLIQLYRLIRTGEPMLPEDRVDVGELVRIKSGVFKGFEGTVVRRENEVRLLISVRYMGRGASVLLEDCQVEVIKS